MYQLDADRLNYTIGLEQSAVPVVPDLAETVKVGSDHEESLTNVFGDAENGNFTLKFPKIF